MRALHICYFGLRENLVQTQVLPYLEELARDGHEMSIITFEPDLSTTWSKESIREQQRLLRTRGIDWRPLAYHKSPSLPATLYDILCGVLFIWRSHRQSALDLLHARSHIPMIMALLARSLTRSAVIFDIRGLIADEYVDAGIWRQRSIIYRVMKRLEMVGIRQADWLIVLTRRMRDYLGQTAQRIDGRISVIPCCIDARRFGRSSAPLPEAPMTFEVVYAGSVTGLYLLEEMGRFFLALVSLVPHARLKILTAAPAGETSTRLRQIGLDPTQFDLQSVSPELVPQILANAAVGISFRKPAFSQIAASPTKVPEYLMAGLPVISNAGIGDTDQILQSERVGIVISELNQEGYRRAARQLLELWQDPDLRHRCRSVALRQFALNEVGGRLYGEAYRQIDLTRQQSDN